MTASSKFTAFLTFYETINNNMEIMIPMIGTMEKVTLYEKTVFK